MLTWGHAPAVAAAGAGWLLLAPGRGAAASAGAGLAFGLAAAFRNEGLLLCAVVAARRAELDLRDAFHPPDQP